MWFMFHLFQHTKPGQSAQGAQKSAALFLPGLQFVLACILLYIHKCHKKRLQDGMYDIEGRLWRCADRMRPFDWAVKNVRWNLIQIKHKVMQPCFSIRNDGLWAVLYYAAAKLWITADDCMATPAARWQSKKKKKKQQNSNSKKYIPDVRNY